MHFKRLIVAALLLPVLYLYIMRLPEWSFFPLILAVATVAIYEFCSMYRVAGILKYSCLLFGAGILSASFFSYDYIIHTLTVSVIAIMSLRLFSKKDPASSLSELAAPVVGIFYIPVLVSFQVQLRKMGPEWIIFLYSTVWAADSAAYYIGKGIGKRKLYKEVSPNKTVAGAAGSLIGGLLGALVIKALMVPRLEIYHAVVIGIITGIISIVGDLVESMFKRDSGVKDSGVIIPGHGGILDKIDGSLFAGPALYWILSIINME